MIPILILAAGQGTRMRGDDKMLEDVCAVPLLRKQAIIAIATGQPVFVALPEGNSARADALTGLEVTTFHLPEAAEGMSGTMRGAVVRLPTCAAFMMVLGDLVALQTEDLQQVIYAYQTHPNFLIWRGATQAGAPGHPIIFDSTLRDEFAGLLGDTGARALVRPHKKQTYLIRLPDDRARLDLDTPEDWAAWRARSTRQ